MFSLIKRTIASDVLLGAFIASLLGIITHYVLRVYDKRKEIRKHSTILYYDLEYLLNQVRLTHNEMISLTEMKENKKQNSHDRFNKLMYAPQWREYCATISGEIDVHRLFHIYRYTERYNKAVEDNDYNELWKSVCMINCWDLEDWMMGGLIETNDETLVRLEALSKINTTNKLCINKLINEIKYTLQKKKLFNLIEEKAVEVLKNYSADVLSSSVLESRVMDWYNKQPQNFRQKNDRFIERIIRDVISCSKNINSVWGECRLKKE